VNRGHCRAPCATLFACCVHFVSSPAQFTLSSHSLRSLLFTIFVQCLNLFVHCLHSQLRRQLRGYDAASRCCGRGRGCGPGGSIHVRPPHDSRQRENTEVLVGAQARNATQRGRNAGAHTHTHTHTHTHSHSHSHEHEHATQAQRRHARAHTRTHARADVLRCATHAPLAHHSLTFSPSYLARSLMHSSTDSYVFLTTIPRTPTVLASSRCSPTVSNVSLSCNIGDVGNVHSRSRALTSSLSPSVFHFCGAGCPRITLDRILSESQLQ
jgi:hypothetical protein